MPSNHYGQEGCAVSTWLRKTKLVPGSAPGGYVWDTPEDLVEVEDDILAAELLEIPDAGFVSVPAPAEEPEQEAEASPGGEGENSAKGGAPAKPASKRAASKASAAKTEVQE